MSTGRDPSGYAPREGQGEEDDRTFADVLNAFSFDSARRMRKKSGPGGTPEAAAGHAVEHPLPAGPAEPFEHATYEQPAYEQAAYEQQPTAIWQPEHDEAQDSASFVRAYTWTGGRTRSNYNFEVETLVTTTDLGHRSTAAAQAEYRAVIPLCRQPKSVAEVAALLSLPLGVAKVLLSDMAELGLIVVHQSPTADGSAPDRTLMERVLSGLRRL
jgi:Protein of unknown function (DUF742)